MADIYQSVFGDTLPEAPNPLAPKRPNPTDPDFSFFPEAQGTSKGPDGPPPARQYPAAPEATGWDVLGGGEPKAQPEVGPENAGQPQPKAAPPAPVPTQQGPEGVASRPPSTVDEFGRELPTSDQPLQDVGGHGAYIGASARAAWEYHIDYARQDAVQDINEKTKQAFGIQLEDPAHGGYYDQAVKNVVAAAKQQPWGEYLDPRNPESVWRNGAIGFQNDIQKEQYRLWDQKRREIADQHPNGTPDNPDATSVLDADTPASMLGGKYSRAAQDAASAAWEASDKPWWLGPLGAGVGMASGAPRDPINTVAMMLTGPAEFGLSKGFYAAGRPFLGAVSNITEHAVAAALTNMGITLPQEPWIQAENKERGDPYGFLPALQDVAESGVYGAVPGGFIGGIKALGHLFGDGAKPYIDEFIRQAKGFAADGPTTKAGRAFTDALHEWEESKGYPRGWTYSDIGKNRPPPEAEAPRAARPTEAAAEAPRGAADEEPGAPKQIPPPLWEGKPYTEPTVRFYHGGQDPTEGGPRWATPHFDYARNFRGGPNEVHYVDVPVGHPTEVAARMWDEFDEAGKTSAVGRHGNVELPEELAKKLRPVPGTERPYPTPPVAPDSTRLRPPESSITPAAIEKAEADHEAASSVPALPGMPPSEALRSYTEAVRHAEAPDVVGPPTPPVLAPPARGGSLPPDHVPPTAGGAVVRTTGYEGPDPDVIKNRIAYLQQQADDPNTPPRDTREFRDRVRGFGEYIEKRDAALKAEGVPEEHAAAIRALVPGDVITSVTPKGRPVTGKVLGWGYDGIISVGDAQGLDHDVLPAKITDIRKGIQSDVAPSAGGGDGTYQDTASGKPYTGNMQFPVRGLKTDAQAYQYKRGGDVNGVTDRLRTAKAWNRMAAGNIVVHERENGDRYVVDGHQRTGLANRIMDADPSQKISVPGFLLKESNGWTIPKARAEAAKKNLSEGLGDPIDVARILRDAPEIWDDTLPVGRKDLREGVGIAKLAEDAFLMVANERVSTAQGALVGSMVADPALHAPLLQDFIDFKPKTVNEEKLLISDVLAAEDRKVMQPDIFGDGGMREVRMTLRKEKMQVFGAAEKLLREDKRVFSVLSNEADRIIAAGNVLTDTNESIADRAGQLAQGLLKLADRTGPISAALERGAQEVADGKHPKTVAREFVKQIPDLLKQEGLKVPEVMSPPAYDVNTPEGRDEQARDLDREFMASQPGLFGGPAAAPKSLEAQRDAIHDHIKQMILDADVPEREAQANAEVFTARIMTRAARLGRTDPERFYREQGWIIRGDAQRAAEAAGEPAGGRVLDQPDMAVTETPEFKAWFGDSKVVDGDGKPVTMYHGTSKDRDFDRFKVGRHGSWFTSDPEDASQYAIENDSQGFRYEGGAFVSTNQAARVLPVYLKITNPFRGDKPSSIAGASNYKKAQSDWFDQLRAQGHDGWLPDSVAGKLAVVFDSPTQIKSATGNSGAFDPNSPRILDQPATVPTFYSAVERAVTNAKQAKASPEQWLATIKNMPGVKPDELKFLGIEDWLKSQTGSVTRDAVADFVRANSLELKEVEKSAANNAFQLERMTALNDEFDRRSKALGERHADLVYAELNDYAGQSAAEEAYDAAKKALTEILDEIDRAEREPVNNPKFSTYVLPGGENYREMLLTLPAKAEGGNFFQRALRELGHADDANLTPEERQAVEARGREIMGRPPDNVFRSSHWEEPNVLAHIRFDDRVIDGKRALHVAEFQSDWHQQGRKQGYRLPSEETSLMDSEYRQLVHKNADARAAGREPDPADVARATELEAALIRSDKSNIPDAPFKTTWPELTIKRIVRYASENGYDLLTWDTGATNAERYDLSKQVDRIESAKRDDGRYKIEAHFINGGSRVIESEAKDLPDAVGKELADKIIEHHDSGDYFVRNKKSGNVGQRFPTAEAAAADLARYPDSMKNQLEVMQRPAAPREWRGLDLKVGGEGMKGFYDKIIPAAVSKLTKKFGGKVGEAEVAGKARDTDTVVPDAQAQADHQAAWDAKNEEIERLEGERRQAIEDYKAAKRAWNTVSSSDPRDPLFRAYSDAQLRLDASGDAVAGAMAEREDLHAQMVRETIARKPNETVPVHSLEITPQLREAAVNEGFPLFQATGTAEEPRARVTMRDNSKAIDLFNKRNASSLMHEAGHIFLDDMARDAKLPNAPQQIKDDFATVLKWLGAKDAESITDAQHEKFTRGWEQYLREGKAPSAALARAFAAFKKWLIAIYKSIRGLGEEIPDKMRGVFDRLIATDEEIAQYRAHAGKKGEPKPKVEAEAAPANQAPTASWVIREKGTGKVVMETFDRKKVDALNTKKYEAIPIQEHLASLNKGGAPERGEIGKQLAPGQVVKTASGRSTTPFPKVDITTERKAAATVKRVDQWLMDNAAAEARARGDDFNAPGFERNRDKPSQSDKDSAEQYLFGDAQPEVLPSILKPINFADLKAAVEQDKARAAAIAESGNPTRLYHQDGRSALIGPDMSKPGGFRVTRFDDQGPIGHTEHASMQDAAMTAVTDGFRLTPEEAQRAHETIPIEDSGTPTPQEPEVMTPEMASQLEKAYKEAARCMESGNPGGSGPLQVNFTRNASGVITGATIG